MRLFYTHKAENQQFSNLNNLLVFHSINKSGSKSLIQTFRLLSGDLVRIVKSPLEMLQELEEGNTRKLIMGHNLYSGYKPSNSSLFTQFRNPVARMVSIWHWWRMKQIKGNGPAHLDSFEDFMSDDKKLFRYSMTAHFAVPFNAPNKLRMQILDNLPHDEALTIAKLKVRRDFDTVTFAEYFEESIFIIAQMLGVDKVNMWIKDSRNQTRPLLSDLSSKTLSGTKKLLWYDYELYAEFLSISQILWRKTIDENMLFIYKEACSKQYKERIPSYLL